MRFSGKKKYRKVVTVLETVVVVGIILIFSAFIFFITDEAMKRSRDARRIEDIDQIKNALALYFHDHGDHIEYKSGCGLDGNGSGWLNYKGDRYPRSISECLISGKYLPDTIKDPLASRGRNDNSRDYMKISNPESTCIFARMERMFTSKEAGLEKTTCPSCGETYGMNYSVCLDK